MKPIYRLANILAALLLAAATLSPVPRAAAGPEPPPTPTPLPGADDLAPPEGGETVAPDGAVFFDPPGCTLATASFGNLSTTPIPDASADNLVPGVITSTVHVSGANSFLWRLVVTTGISHTFNADLDIFLISPAGTTVTLSTDNGGSLDNVFSATSWEDYAGRFNPPGPVTMVTMANNVAEPYLSPEEPLSAFMGENPNGDWKLVIRDNAFHDVGTLHGWSLSVAALPAAPASRTQFTGALGGVPIPDDGTPVEVAMQLPTIQASLGELGLSTGIAHPRSGDLIIELVPPSGVTITIANRLGGTLSDIFDGAVFTDNAGATNPPGPITDNTLANGVAENPVAPQEPLGAAAYATPGGIWKLIVRDMAPGQQGTIAGAFMQWTQYTCRPDLVVSPKTPKLARLTEPIPLALVVNNFGAASGTVALTSTLPAEAHFISAGGAGWSCAGPAAGTLGGTLHCSRPSLAANTTTTVTVLASAGAPPRVLGTLAVTATTASELNLGDNAEDAPVYIGAHSANGNGWDVADSLLYGSPLDRGAMSDGGEDAFDDFGALRLRLLDPGGGVLTDTEPLGGFGLIYGPGQRWHTTTPVAVDTIRVARSLYAPEGTNWLRYVDTFTNTGGASRTVVVGWGGNLGSDSLTLVKATSSGDATLAQSDTWGVTIENQPPFASDPPLGFIVRSALDTTFLGPGIYADTPFTGTWPSAANDTPSFNFKFSLAPGASASLAYFLYRGRAEGQDGPEDCDLYGGCVVRPVGSELTPAQNSAPAIALHPDFCDLTPAELARIRNWPGAVLDCSLVDLPVVIR